MAITIIDVDFTGQYNIAGSDSRWILAQGIAITSTGHGINEGPGSSGNVFDISGTVTSTATIAAGIYLGGTGDVLTITAAGIVKGTTGVSLQGSDQTLVNNGLIDGGNGISLGSGTYDITNNGTIKAASNGYGANWSGDGTDFTNNGTITGKYGLMLSGSTDMPVLGADSVIKATSIGLMLDSQGGISSTTHNQGLLQGGTTSFAGDEGNETLVNTGRLVGTVKLYEGNDVFDNRGGTFSGIVEGGRGSDTYYVNSQKIVVADYGNNPEDSDVVYATASYALTSGYDVEKLVLLGKTNINASGDATDNTLIGNAGKNRISGGVGTDTLSGKAGADTFVFKTGFGQDTITDYADGPDSIDISGLTPVTSFADLRAHHLSFSHGDAIITSGSDRLTIEDTTRAELDKSDFLI